MSDINEKEIIESAESADNTDDLENIDDLENTESLNTKKILSNIGSFLICVAVAFVINTVFIINAKIPTPSMESTIMTGDRIFGNRLAYWFDEPEKGDIVVFFAPDEPKKKLIKRVIGTPGDKVEIVEGQLYINDELTEEPYLNEEMWGSFGVYDVPEDNYLMLGDNRNHSEDSRFWVNTYVSKDAILGKAMFTYYPKIHAIK